MDIETETIDVKGAAKLLGVGEKKIYQLCKDGKIPYVIVGKKQYKFLPESLRKWLKYNNQKNTTTELFRKNDAQLQ